MAKGGKFTKLIKKLSFGKSSKTNATLLSSDSNTASSSSLASDASLSSATSDVSACNLQTVYVGKSRRRYLLPSDVVSHPILQQLSGKSTDDDEITVAGCEVVLFEHLLWMLENADPMPESLDEIAHFYAC
ncbi:auxin-responsive protein SAUR76-like [Amaranthus tricolor]|uniref:auxin-responsive protein SAUR76-like n=1 Tax=Amaranthus tricolor TaxID=29722 RepID=UPI002587B55C|nr:auxin-responsive protein SAUR76-like [Amaranthus tricolor]